MAEKEKTLYTFAVRVGESAADALHLLARDFGGNVSMTLPPERGATVKTILILVLCLLILAACSPTTTTTSYDQSGTASCTGFMCRAEVRNTTIDGPSIAVLLAFICLFLAVVIGGALAAAGR